CAVEIQKGLHIHNLSAENDRQIRIRIGIHLGDVEHRSDDVFGDGVNIASRIEPLAPAEGVCVTRQVADHVAKRLDLALVSQGEHDLKNIQHPVEVFQVRMPWQDQSGAETPAPTAEAPPTQADDQSIAVLPLADLSPDRDNEYFSDGMTEEIIMKLSRIHSLTVISRTSAMRFKGTDQPMPAIAGDLGARYVLEGTVRKAGDDLRITAQLIDAPQDAHLWAETYRGTLEDVFAIQERVGQAIVDELAVQLTESESEALGEEPMADVQAYDYYLRARQDINSFTEEGIDRALNLLEKSLEVVGPNVHVYAGLGYAHWQYHNIGVRQDEGHLETAEAYAQKILAIDPDAERGLLLMGQIEGVHRGNVITGARYVKRAYRQNPNDPDTLFWLSAMLSITLGHPEANRICERLERIDPLDVSPILSRSLCHAYQGQWEQALQVVREREASSFRLPFSAAYVLAALGRFAEASARLDEYETQTSQDFFALFGRFFKEVIEGNNDEALTCVTPELMTISAQDAQFSHLMADAYALLGDKDQAYRWLEHAVDCGFLNHPFLSEHDPFLEPLRGEARFQQLLADVEERRANVLAELGELP
ncbi:MAG: adenylate/guanylate cyclase domain-containing protein, partial [Candidatus Bipolaricaulia bacterium]